MTSPFSKESIADGTFTKMTSIICIFMIVMICLVAFIIMLFLSITQHIEIPALALTGLSTVIGAGVSFFIKAAGVADGAAIASNTINAAVPQIAQAMAQVSNAQVQSANINANATAANTAATRQNTAAIQGGN